MPMTAGSKPFQAIDQFVGTEDVNALHRKLFVLDKAGNWIEMRTKADFDFVISQMTPDEFAIWQARYRFEPIQNNTGVIDYTGTQGDCS